MRTWICTLLAASALTLVGCGPDETTGTAPEPAGTDGAAATTGEDPAATDDGGTTDGLEDPVVDPDDDTLRILEIDPGVGRAKGGDVITIVGNNFLVEGTQVFFGASLATDVFVINETRLTATTPPGNPGLVDVLVAVPSREVTARLEKAFRYQSDMLVIAVDPPTGDVRGGTPVTVSGSGFSQGPLNLLFGDRTAIDVQVVDDFTIHATTPEGDQAGPVDVHVGTEQGLARLEGGFRFTQLPGIDAVIPAVGPVEGGAEVTIVGRGFEADTVVLFGDAEATKVTWLDSQTLLVVTPAGFGPGPVSVLAETEFGYGGLPTGYHYVAAAPTTTSVVSVQPDIGSEAGGDTVRVTAYGLDTAEDTEVFFGDSPAEVVEVDAQNLFVTVVTPPGAVGDADVTVATSNGEDTLEAGFEYAELLTITAVEPFSGPVTGKTPITVYGIGFEAGASVRIGALPCADVQVTSDKSIECTTPAGSPGGASVTVTQGTEAAHLPDAYFYEAGSAELFVVDPDTGSQAGGTFVRLLGAGFEAPVQVRFEGASATHVKVVSSTLILARTPPGAVGVASVEVTTQGTTATLADSFTYFDPVALYGGTWGPGVEGAVNVTVLDGGSGAPLADAFVILKVDPDTPYQGFSNSQGQITFSGPDVLGTQMVSASKDGYASASVIEFDATNITIYLQPIPTPSSGPPGPAASIKGTVSGLGKYVITPPGLCSSKFPQAGEQCAACTTIDECTGANLASCTQIGDQGTFCTQACAADSDCDLGYSCLHVSGTGAGPQCVPSPGQKQARCYFTMGPQLPESQTPFIVKDDGTFQIPTRIGEVAVVCLGGVVAWGNPDNESNFTAYAFGVKRHVLAVPGITDVGDVTLNHPLTRTVNVRLDDPPYDGTNGPNVSIAQLYWDFGSDGQFFHPNFVAAAYMFGSDDVSHQIPRQPSAWSGDVYDATFQIVAGAVTLGNGADQFPQSLTVLRNLKDIETDSTYVLEAGQWEAVESGVTKSVFATHGFAENDVWAVGADGAILHRAGLGWALQASPTQVDLFGVWGAAPDDVWAVGEDGTTLRFDGTQWTEVEGPNTGGDLAGVWGSGPDDVWVVGRSWSGFHHWDGTTWTQGQGASSDFRDVHGVAPDAIWAVGRYNSVRFYDGTSWTTQSVPVSADWASVHAIHPADVWIVGSGGASAHWDGFEWTEVPTPVNRGLRAVWARASDDVYAVGDGTTLLHWDGSSWSDQTLPGKVSYASLQALWGNEDGVGVALGTAEVLMGPLLQVPTNQNPEDGGSMQGYDLSFGVAPGVDARYNLIEVFIPSPLGETPVWSITTDGDVFDFVLPDFENLEGTPGIAPGGYGLRIMRGWNEDFDIDNYDNFDFNPRSWAIDVTTFTK